MNTTITGAPAGARDCTCASATDKRILHRVGPPSDLRVTNHPVEPIRTLALIDTETTGLDSATDAVIEIAYLIIEVDALGQLVRAVRRGAGFIDPGRPIPERVTQLTGITDADVRGCRIDPAFGERVLGACDVLLAHNAGFDAPFVERLMQGLAGKAWACSASDYDWLANGWDGRKQGHLLMQAGWFNDAHRAAADVASLLHLLVQPSRGLNLTILGEVLANAERPTVRLEATGAPFSTRGELKARGYRWSPRDKVWWTEVAEADEPDEIVWLHELNRWGPEPRRQLVTWHERHR